LHLQHGPIDLVVEAWGRDEAIAAAMARGEARFASVLDELVAELPRLRTAATPALAVGGAVARRMLAACLPFHPQFVTPMAAVAGAVADEILAACLGTPADARIERAVVNNGGDIALHLAPGSSLRLAVVSNPTRPTADALATLEADWPARGIATSGWRGRSLSLGIADSVTTFARTAAQADAAATMIANAVDLDDPRIERRPAIAIRDDSDLGERLVTVGVPALDAEATARALAAGVACASACLDAGRILGAGLFLQGQFRWVGGPRVALSPSAG